MDIFLVEGPLHHKLCYFIYTMLDLMALVDAAINDSLSTHIHSLLTCLVPGEDYSELSSLVSSFWSLDHREYNVGCSVTSSGKGICFRLPLGIRQSIVFHLINRSHNENFISKAICYVYLFYLHLLALYSMPLLTYLTTNPSHLSLTLDRIVTLQWKVTKTAKVNRMFQ